MANSVFNYDVFLSFHGKDTRRNFTDHLYTALKHAGVRTFRDDDAMDRGRLLEPELKKAICESAISLIVFSKNYASSKWCLDEVVTIIEEKRRFFSKHEVVPVFYDIDPTDVRNQTGSFEQAFRQYDAVVKAETDLEKKKEWLKKVKAWKVSLKTAGSLTGLVFTDRYESKFIIKVVDVIRKKLDYKALYIDEKTVVKNSDVAKIKSFLSSKATVILLVAQEEEVGRTSISKRIYNSFYREYAVSCFLADVNDTSNQPNGLLRLQTQLLSTVLKSKHEETIWNIHEGTIKIADAIRNKKLLLILDDVTSESQLNALIGGRNPRFHPGSKVIITTRNKGLVKAMKFSSKVHTLGKEENLMSFELVLLFLLIIIFLIFWTTKETVKEKSKKVKMLCANGKQ